MNVSEQIRLRAAALDEPVTIELHFEEAPETCASILESLPIEGEFVNGKFSGDEVYTALSDDRLSSLNPENWEYNALPGDVGYWYSHWGDGRYERGKSEKAELVLVYGRRVRIRKGSDRVGAINLFGSVTENLEQFAAVCGRIQREGAKTFHLERV